MQSRNRLTKVFSAISASRTGYVDDAVLVRVEYTSMAPQSPGRRLARVEAEPESGGTWSDSKLKRAFDVIVAGAALLVLSPLILLTALLVKLSSKGPVLFRQTRVGKNGTNFKIWKFRTMRTDCPGGPCVTKAGDERLTPVGGALRRFKFDEFPQLINVLRGEMSIVGARPKVPHHQTHFLRYRPA